MRDIDVAFMANFHEQYNKIEVRFLDPYRKRESLIEYTKQFAEHMEAARCKMQVDSKEEAPAAFTMRC